MPKRLSEEEFKNRITILYGDKYDLSEVNYKNNQTKVKVTCNEHNINFLGIPSNMMRSRPGCIECEIDKRKKTNINKYGFCSPGEAPHIKEKAKQTNLERYGFCSPGEAPHIKEKAKQTNLERYGYEYPAKSPEIQEKIKQTNIERYGHENPFGSLEIQEKIKQTNLERYGYEYPMKSLEIQEKAKTTNLKNLGVEYPMQAIKVQEKSKETNLERYGYENPFESPEIQEKIKQTNLERYGYEYPIQSLEIQEKSKKTCLKKYNHEYSLQSSTIRNKSKKTCLNKYAREFYSQKHIPQETLNLLNNPNWLIEQHHIQEKTWSHIAILLNISFSSISNYYKKYNIEHKYFKKSLGQKEVEWFLMLHGFEIISNTKKILPNLYELDIWIQSIKKAVEYNGLYWHKYKGQDYHLWKTSEVDKRSGALFHVWEDMWLNHQEETKAMLLKFINDIPQVPLTEIIIIDLATDNPQIYIDLGYKIEKQFPPELYSEGVWDCGKMILNKP